LATRLLGLGHGVTVWNRTAAKIKPALDAGAKGAQSPAEVVRHSDFVITILTDAAAIDAVYGDLLAGDVAGKMFIEMSTVRPAVEEALAARVRAKGASFIECPVGGTVGPAREGKLLGFVGGEPADVAHARPILDQLCRRVEHVGPVGAGSSMKLAINLPLLVFWQAFGEALALCRHLKRDPAWLVELFADTSGGPNVLKSRGPVLAAVLAGRESGPTTVDIATLRKDLQTMVEEAKARGFDLPAVAGALNSYNAAVAAGWGSRDVSAMPSYWMMRGQSG
jgi:3-hydroxyisobutyrate dehydrogenase